MPPTILQKNWQFDDNRVASVASILDAGSHLLWYLKALACNQIALTAWDGTAVAIGASAGKWSVKGSSDGVTAGMDNVDRLGGGVYDGTKWVRAGEGTAHSWVVLQDPSGTWNLCVNFAGSSDYLTDFILSKNAFTGGSTTARPTAVNEQSFWTASSQYKQLVQNVAPTAAKVHGRLATDGSFFVMRSVDGSGRFDFACGFNSLAETMAEETHNGWFTADFLSSGNGAFTANTIASIQLAITLGRLATGGAGGLSGTPFNYLGNSSGALFGQMSGVDATNSKFRDFPIYQSTYGVFSLRGRYVDWKWVPQSTVSLPIGDLFPLSGAPELVRVGDTALPARAALSL
jgi:hypothetical protein